jgi:hypothetical protein
MQGISDNRPTPTNKRRAFHTPEAGFEETGGVAVSDSVVFMFHALSIMDEG